MALLRTDNGKDAYLKSTKAKMVFLAILLALTVFTSFAVLYFDLKYFTVEDMFKVLFHVDDPSIPQSRYILMDYIYVPRMVAGILAGCALGLAGTVMQCILRNPLGSPYTLGISNAAAFGASISIVITSNYVALSSNILTYYTFLMAFTFAMIATGIIILLVVRTRVDPSAMVLAGVAISSIFAAGVSFLQYIFSTDALAEIVFWQFGSLGKPTMDQLKIVFVVTAVVSVYFYLKRWHYNALNSGDEVASSLGVDVKKTRLIGLLLCSILSAVVVSFMGIISFIGLISPHMVRLTMGNDHRFLIPASMLFGAIIISVSDCIGQNLFTQTVPVGIITAFLGGPLFLYILLSGYRKKSSNMR